MFNQNISGIPPHCLNRTCKAKFFKESHLGWLPHTETEVFAIMRCSACKDTFAVVQMISIVHEYYDRLPRDPKVEAARTNNRAPISLQEVKNVRKRTQSSQNLLSELAEGSWPGSPGYGGREEE